MTRAYIVKILDDDGAITEKILHLTHKQVLDLAKLGAKLSPEAEYEVAPHRPS